MADSNINIPESILKRASELSMQLLLIKGSVITNAEVKGVIWMEKNETDLAADSEDEQLGDFLLSTERLYDVYFVVGNADLSPTERIGAVKACLMNQSRVFRRMLHESVLAERGEILVPDIQPSIFRLLLKHCYGGLETCRPLTPELTVRLCYAAEKYLIGSLKKKVAERLKPESTLQIFPALHCLVTYNVEELEHCVTEMVKEQTENIFSSDGFVDIDVNSLEFIVKQDTLNCQEIDVWRAVFKWATNKAQRSEGLTVREWMALPLKHIRLMTLSHEDLCRDVLPVNVLTFDEFVHACSRNEHGPTTIYSVTEKRQMFHERWKWWETVAVNHEAQENRWAQSHVSHSCIVVGERNIMLESVTCLGATSRPFHDCYGLSYPCRVDIIITRITDYISSTSSDDPINVTFNGSANFYEQFTIPTLVSGEAVTLRANCMYKLRLSFLSPDTSEASDAPKAIPLPHPCWHAPTCSDGHSFSHGKFYCSYIYEDGIGRKPSHVIKFQYSYRR